LSEAAERSGASQSSLDNERERGRLRLGRAVGRKGKQEVLMSDEIITTKSGVYGRVNVVLPMLVKEQMLSWMQKSSMKKAQFFRTALMIGTVQLAQQLGIKDKTDDHFISKDSAIAQQPARR
jgi:hypothetical protein